MTPFISTWSLVEAICGDSLMPHNHNHYIHTNHTPLAIALEVVEHVLWMHWNWKHALICWEGWCTQALVTLLLASVAHSYKALWRWRWRCDCVQIFTSRCSMSMSSYHWMQIFLFNMALSLLVNSHAHLSIIKKKMHWFPSLPIGSICFI